MARKPRIDCPGALYHCLNRGHRRKPLFLSDDDSLFLLDCLKQVVGKYGVYLHGYCLMPNHFHLILQVQQPPLSPLSRTMCSEGGLWQGWGLLEWILLIDG